MPKFRDLTGQKFNRLSVLRHLGKNASKKQVWECLCDCGVTKPVDGGSLVSGNTTSCGCYLKERITKHGGWNKSSYHTWAGMMQRCYSVKSKDYPRYGGSGIEVCVPWREYVGFVKDMGEPEGNQTLDRIDPYGSYTPDNCRWASPYTQARNTRARKNKSGYRGIQLLDNGKWMAFLNYKKKPYYGKCRVELEDALEDRRALEHKFWVEA